MFLKKFCLSMSRKFGENFWTFYFANREQFVLPAPWCASFRHEGNYNGGDAAAGSPPCIGRDNGRVDLISEVLPSGRLCMVR
jgi:hypothetical protein